MKDAGRTDPCAVFLPEGDSRYLWVSFSPGMKVCCAKLQGTVLHIRNFRLQ